MARPISIQFEGAVYHVMSRGNARQTIFTNDADRLRFLSIASQLTERYHVVIHAYCLMGNHYHVVIETPQGNLSKAIRQLNGVYSQYFNRRHVRVGHVFQGRFRGQLIGADDYFLAACRYVVLNPVRAGLVSDPAGWRWSNYRATLGLDRAPGWLDIGAFLDRVDSASRSQALRNFKRFVAQGLVSDSILVPEPSASVFASPEFTKMLDDRLAPSRREREMPRRHRFADRPGLDNLFSEIRGKSARNVCIKRAHIDCGYTMKEIAEHLGVHYATVSRAIRRMS